MPVTHLYWPPTAAHDYHLVPGLTSPRLNQLLNIGHTAGNVRADAPPAGVVVSFAANFAAGAPGTAGVVVNPATGEVTVGALPAPPRLLDFLVVATVTEGANSFTAYVRFHLHESITRMWLTPAELTVRVGARNVRFSTIAEFSDGTYGDVSNWSPWEFDPARPADLTFVHLSGVNQPLFTWGTTALGDMDVDAQTGVLDCSRGAASATISAVSPLPAGIASGRAVGAGGWALGATVERIEGPGFAKMATTPNILILGDGFEITERVAFITLARLLVKDLHTAPRTDPFKMLKDGMNYFAALVPSREGGISNLNPIDRTPLPGAQAEAKDADVAVAPTAVAASAANIGAPPTPATNSRFILNERDTAFGVTRGERPKAQRRDPIRTPQPSRRRFDEDDFDVFLGALKDPAGNPVGRHWQRTGNGPGCGKDETSIVILLRTNLYGGANTHRADSGNIICAGLGTNHKCTIQAAAGGLGHDIVPDPIPAAVPMVLRLRAAHELGHSFTLGDEYGGGGPFPASDPSQVDRADGYANVQPRIQLLTANSLDADLIKWGKWPRIAKAGVLTAAPVAAAGGHRLVLTPGHADAFAIGDIVRLRTRPLPTSVQSERLRVTGKVGNAELTVAAVGPPLAGAFPAGSIVMEPMRAPDQGGALGDDLNLVHADVRRFIDGQHNPLNAAFHAAPDRPCPPAPGTEKVYGYSTPSVNYGQGNAPNPPRESAWITGLFEQGMGFDCEVYHPTGACLMNVYSYDGFVSSFQFCWICRYAMVDFVDPTLHGKVDAGYASRYPK
jgi:hypothetical protein